MAAKTRPTVVLIADNLDAPRSLIIHIPITRQNRGSELEVPLGHLPFLDPESVANVQAIGSLPFVRFEKLAQVLSLISFQPPLVNSRLGKYCRGVWQARF